MKMFALLFCVQLLSFCQDTTPPVKSPAPAASPAAADTKRPVKRRVASLEDCPEAVRNAVKKNGHDRALAEITLIETKGVKTYAFETGTEDGGKDNETNYFYSSEGVLLRTEKDMPLKDTPAAVQEALKKLAGTTAVVDDVEEVTDGTTVTYKAEIESNGGADKKARLSATGEVLELIEETDD